jgi:hypothetical protein
LARPDKRHVTLLCYLNHEPCTGCEPGQALRRQIK